MNQDNQGNNPDASGSVPEKRKRGRPRKYPKTNINYGEIAHIPRDQNLNHGENVRAPPGYDGADRQQPRPADSIGDANAVVVGQPLHGVIDAAFDAGYLLSVRVGNSDTTLRGVVFKPGHYVPVSADNDVVPNVPMIRRNNVPFPTENNTQVQGSRSRDNRNGTAHLFNESSVTNQVPRSKRRQMTSVPEQTAQAVIPRANLVPVVLQPANLSIGGPVANQPSAFATQVSHLASSNGKQIPQAAHTSHGSTPTNQVLTVGNQVLHSQSQSGHQVIPRGMQRETGLLNQPPAEILHEVQGKSMRSPGMPFEKLLSEVMKRIEAPSQSVEAKTEDQALTIEPLQVVQPDLSLSMPKPLENYRTGKMTELLKAVQENMIETQASLAKEPDAGSRIPENELGDKETVDCNTCPKASNV